jgi:hypothetical protein
VDPRLSRSPQTSGTTGRVRAPCSLLTREARIPVGTGPFCFLAPRGLRPSRRNAALAATFINKMPRSSTGTGRMRASQSCGCSSEGRARPRHGRGRGFESLLPLHFGCALAPPFARTPRERRRRDVHGVAPHVQREHLVGLPITRAWTQPKWNHALVAQLEERLPCKQRVARSNRRLGHQIPDQKSCALTREAETGRKDRAAPELVTGPTRGCSSVGRAPALQAGCRRFDACRLHQTTVR